MASTVKVQSKILRRERSTDEYAIYRAGLEWDLIDPIVIENRDDVKSGDRWKDHVEPFWHQVNNLITFCRRLPVTLLADDVGLGKTISAGLIVSELMARSRLSKFLVICPKILGPQWKEELETKFGIHADVIAGRDLLDADPDEGGAVITTYNSARLHLEKLPKDRFQMLILDEAHKLRNLFGVDKPPQVAIKLRSALEERRFNFVLMLTATPIQNRLWDLYSLVELLCVARGHQNPFGSPGMFERKYIADGRDTARQLRLSAQEDFRSVVYSYMSRVRRGDAKLYFPTRHVSLARITPSSGELQLIECIAKPIQVLNRLIQISILQALVSSPEALSAQLDNMAQNGTVPSTLASDVRTIVQNMPTAAKLEGLGVLVGQLQARNPGNWRAVIFTTRRETQTTIEAYLSGQGIKVGVINGSTGGRNQETISQFKAEPPTIHVIVSTEAGSEGVNLQAANVLVNYDLPWNPMIVEQRIGRVQRLGSKHENVAIHNVVLLGTFEEYIVGRLMEKLQMASHAIGDIESLLQASGVTGDDEADDFEGRVLELVLASLAGKNMERDIELVRNSIDEARIELERERDNIDSLLGDESTGEQGPRAPSLPPIERSMPFEDFVVAAYRLLGASVQSISNHGCLVEKDGRSEAIFFNRESSSGHEGMLLMPGTPEFSRLVDRVVATGVHRVEDLDSDPERRALETARAWVGAFGARPQSTKIDSVEKLFDGTALVRVRANVQHDSFERLVEVRCPPYQIQQTEGRSGLAPLASVLERVEDAGLHAEEVAQAAQSDETVSEFCRFYLERREAEVRLAGDDSRKAAKLAEEFTPRLEIGIVGLEGRVRRAVKARILYTFDDGGEYQTALYIDPGGLTLYEAPNMAQCALSERLVPEECLAICEITGVRALRHLLSVSEISGRLAVSEYTLSCSVTGKLVLEDEAEVSEVTGAMVAKSVLLTSEVSGRRAEPENMGKCEFTGALALGTELLRSDLSGKLYRADQQMTSSVSLRTGHVSEFTECHETHTQIATSEAETCEATGRRVRPGILVACEATGKRVLPSQLGICMVTQKRVLKGLLTTSSVSGLPLLQTAAVRSGAGAACLPSEAIACAWSGIASHPEDVEVCSLTGLSVHRDFYSPKHDSLKPLAELLDGIRHTADQSSHWDQIAEAISFALRGGRCRIEAAASSPDGTLVAVRCEVKTLLGIMTSCAGAVYSFGDQSLHGRVAMGKSTKTGWVA